MAATGGCDELFFSPSGCGGTIPGSVKAVTTKKYISEIARARKMRVSRIGEVSIRSWRVSEKMKMKKIIVKIT
jgi:hypothetical protein